MTEEHVPTPEYGAYLVWLQGVRDTSRVSG